MDVNGMDAEETMNMNTENNSENNEGARRKVAVLFPGIGYTCDRPLLYYAGKLADSHGYEIIRVPYGNFPSGVKGNPEKMRQAFVSALEQSEQMLKEIEWSSFAEILFISKSVGTAVSSAYAQQHQLKVRSVLFTPVEQTFQFVSGEAIVFHGTADPWAETPVVTEGCRKAGLPLYITEKANHSLETGDVKQDIENLQKVLRQVEEFLREGDSCHR